MEQDTARLFATPLVIGQVETARQHHMGRAFIGIPPMPFDQRRLVERGRLLGVIGKEHAGARPALNPQVTEFLVLFDHVIAGIEPGRNLQRVLPGAIGHRVDPPLGIHIEQHRAKGFDLRGIQPIGQRANGPRVAERVDKELVGIDHQCPMPMPVFRLQPVEPVNAEPRALVTRLGGPQRHILLLRQIIRTAIGAVIIHDQEMRNPQIAIVTQEIGQANMLIPHGRKEQHVTGANTVGAVDNGPHREMLAKGTHLGPFAPQPHPV
mmetsp:Transcript_3030/g.10258  ORF Transcript_3030/g.10258 Transcript_3030/m.10258 type:complete len:265 (-) Transcript_3030:53-847(-)